MSEVEDEIGNTMMKRRDERKSGGDGKDVVFENQVVGIFSARTPNRFVSFLSYCRRGT